MTDRETVLAEITAQGDVVRKLKAAKAEKSKVSTYRAREWLVARNLDA